MSELLQTDGRKRVSLAKLGVEQEAYFLASKRPDGSIVLTPAEVRPKVMDLLEDAIPHWEQSANVRAAEGSSEAWQEAKSRLE